MKNIVRSAVFLLLVIIFWNSHLCARMISFEVIKDQNSHGTVKLLKKSGNLYISISDYCRLYKVNPHYYNISKKIIIYHFNSKVELFFDSEQIMINNTLKTMDTSVISSKKKWYVPVSLLISQSFSEISRYNAYLDIYNRIVDIEKRISVRTPDVFSYKDLSRIAINFDSTIEYRILKEHDDKLKYEFKNGYFGENRDINIDDSVINLIKLESSRKNAIMTVYLSEGAGIRQEYFYKKECYFVIDFARAPLVGDKNVKINNEAPSSLEYVNSIMEMKMEEEKALSVSEIDENKTFEDAEDIDDNVNIVDAEDETFSDAVKDTYESAKTEIKSRSQEIYQAIKHVSEDDGSLKVVIDAGHGGKDPGCIGYAGTREKDINLIVSKKIAIKLKKSGIRVFMTRDDDTFVPLFNRADFANRVRADLFISVHCNASLKTQKKGFEAYFLSEKASDPSAEATVRLENAVLALEGEPKKRNRKVHEVLFSMAKNKFINESSELCGLVKMNVQEKSKFSSYDVKQAGFHVLKGAQMPAVLIECGYLTNRQEEKLLNEKYFQEKIIAGIMEGIQTYEKRKSDEKKK
ncbi:MAG: N-acetylmuramoyl-L-alanine amidase [bacterium]